MANGISFDVEKLTYAAFDQDRSQESRSVLDNFPAPGTLPNALHQHSRPTRLTYAERRVAVCAHRPPEFGRDLLAGQSRKSASGSMAQTHSRQRRRGVTFKGSEQLSGGFSRRETRNNLSPLAQIETRFRYNQAFLSVYAISPGVLMLLMYMFATMLTAVGVVREKELGSITNLYAAPASKLEFLIGKQLPYIGIAMVNFATLVTLMSGFFQVPITETSRRLRRRRPVRTAATSLGLVISSFVSTQLAAIFGSAIIVMIPSFKFSGMLYPVSTLRKAPGGRILGHVFPALYFQRITSGTFNKGLGFTDLYQSYLWLAAFCVIFWMLATFFLKKQEA